MRIAHIFVGAFLVMLVPCHADVIVYSEGFELPEVSGFSTDFSPGWTVSEPDSPSQVGLFNVGVLAFSGTQVADFNANSTPAGGFISLNITTTIGMEYTANLMYYSYVNTGGAVELTLGSSVNSAAAVAASTWYGLSVSFTATQTSTLLQITDISTNVGASDLWIDAVEVTTPVPEPSTMGLIGLGGAGVFALRRRRILN